ncbi:hypothetical protein BU16DRAFT_555 [Lophium mytilinum]|uniref:NAD(P)-binding protein n=1 Tax=Lophium mytilinum TaxID=390894 RepID=A0A6A6REY2_9PEZI|nr:hypothetical protein BU16DRAFT_555 [Lophium mytilinum]
MASQCLVIKEMYNQTELEKEGPNWKRELIDEIGEECREMYGDVAHVGVDPVSSPGDVYIKFIDTAAGTRGFDPHLVDKIVVVTGEARGLGFNMAQAMAEVGAKGIAVIDQKRAIGVPRKARLEHV